MDPRGVTLPPLSRLLFDQAGDTEPELCRQLKARPTGAGAALINSEELERQTVRAMLGVLATPLGDLLCWAWETHHKMKTACNETRATPGLRIPVPLACHQLESTHHPHLMIEVNGIDLALFDLELKVALTIDWAALTIVEGRIESFAVGQISSEAELTSGSWLHVQKRLSVVPALILDMSALEADETTEVRSAGHHAVQA